MLIIEKLQNPDVDKNYFSQNEENEKIFKMFKDDKSQYDAYSKM